jgi:hypothetical protein
MEHQYPELQVQIQFLAAQELLPLQQMLAAVVRNTTLLD